MAHTTHYTTRTLVEAKVPKALVVRACDRNEDGAEDTGAFDNLLETVETEIDGRIGAAVSVPLVTVPALIQDAALVLLAAACYAAVATPEKENPYAAPATATREKLDRIGAGTLALDLDNAPAGTAIDETDDDDLIFGETNQEGTGLG